MRLTTILLLSVVCILVLQSCSKTEYQCECKDWARSAEMVESKTIEAKNREDASIDCNSRQLYYDKHPLYDHVNCSIK